MRKTIIIALIALIAMQICLAEPMERASMPLFIENSFRVFSIEPFSEENILLSGLENKASSDTPGACIVLMQPSGEILWEYKVEEGNEQTRYDCAVQIDENTIAALLDLRDQTGYIDFIEIGGDSHRSELLKGPNRIFANDAGILVNVLWEGLSSLIQMDQSGNVLWTVDIDGYMYVNGIVETQNRIYAYGNAEGGESGRAKLIVLSQNGEVVNEFTSESEEIYTSAESNDGQILILGGKRYNHFGWGVSCFDQDGTQLWRKEIPKISQINTADGGFPFDRLSAIIRCGDHFLIAGEGKSLDGGQVWLYEMDAQGTLLRQKEFYTNKLTSMDYCTLIDLKSGSYLAIYGWVEDPLNADFWDADGPHVVDLGYGLYIQEIGSYMKENE